MKNPNHDILFLYLIMKIGDLIHFSGPSRTSMMGKVHNTFPIMQKFQFGPEILNYLKSSQFWDTYFRHNNYTMELNKQLLKKIKSNRSKKGIFKLAEKTPSTVQEKRFLAKIFKDGILSRSGIRASSLNDIIRYMVYMNFELDVINKICMEITSKYKIMDKKLAYKVFRETEDEFSIRDYVDRKEGLLSGEGDNAEDSVQGEGDDNVEQPGMSVKGFWSLVLEFLEPRDGLELILCNKSFYKDLGRPYIRNVLLRFELTREVRKEIWWMYLPQVGFNEVDLYDFLKNFEIRFFNFLEIQNEELRRHHR